MRWVVSAIGALALLATSYLALRPRLTRPVLRVGLGFRSGNVEDQAVAAGVKLALEERDERGGRFRVAVIPHDLSFSKTNFKMWMSNFEVPDAWADESGATLIDASLDGQAERILDWMKARGLRRVAVPTTWQDNSNSSYAALGMRPNLGDSLEKRMPASDFLWVRNPDTDLLIRRTVEARPDVVVVEDAPGLVDELRAAGFGGFIFLSRFIPKDLSTLDGCLTVLAPLKPTPPDFLRRHPHPFAYAGYRGALAFLDALDAVPDAEPEDHCLPRMFDELRGEPRVYELRGGRFLPK